MANDSFQFFDQNRRMTQAFGMLTSEERQTLTAAMAGNHPDSLSHLREPIIRNLYRAETKAPADERKTEHGD